ncbi:SRPBCC family protein [Akkermansiaceae bacterium]|nr:SRPBCC family protein [Akkermansiaceae bacterium]MDA7888442.1 SRPBCC family protein [Akkermansiaceae bacterium]MDB4537497.1 SRPBCC family protein [Akkermansiaceae bacterium]
MKVHLLEQEQWLPVSVEEAWEFFSSPRNLDEITPSDLGFKIESLPSEKMYEGEIITYKVKLLPGVWMPWVTEIKAVTEGESFIDEQRSGPYRFWHHRHYLEPKDGGTLMRDLVHYSVGKWIIGEMAHRLYVRKKLERIFSFRRRILEERFGKSSD